MGYQYHPMQMHLHTCHQPGSSMEGHMYNAASLGMHYIRFTDHDVRTGPKEFPCNCFDFTKGALVYEDYSGKECGWMASEDAQVTFDGESMILEKGSVEFFSSGRRHTVSLLADVTLKVGLECDGQVMLDVRLSQRPPEHKPAHLYYEIHQCKKAEDGLYYLHLSQDVPEKMGGLDNVFDTLRIAVDGHGHCRIHHFEIEAKYGFDEVIQRQRVLADKIGQCYGIKPFVTTEISAAGQHKNCFSTKVPVIDYQARNYKVTQAEAIAHVQAYGGIFSYNHPFEKYKRMTIPAQEIPRIVQRDAAAMIAYKVWGASLIEVGFLNGRAGFGLAEHLRLWDLLSLGGVFITGYGDSDSHYSDQGWFEGHNFAAWIAADEQTAFPVPEEEFIASMKAGRLYTGDPVFLKGAVELTCEGAPMGAILSIEDHDKRKREMTFTMQSPEQDWKMRLIIDGEVAHEQRIDKTEEFSFSFQVAPIHPVSFARVEVYNASGRCILLTNPIYLVRTAEYAGELPVERTTR
ncbi:MAG: hypothetical protein IJ315_00005 [Firmicutes bacterium]|nr:hypothetical protein [Bacillota bacterium]